MPFWSTVLWARWQYYRVKELQFWQHSGKGGFWGFFFFLSFFFWPDDGKVLQLHFKLIIYSKLKVNALVFHSVSQVGRVPKRSLNPTSGSTHSEFKPNVWEDFWDSPWTLASWGHVHHPGEPVPEPDHPLREELWRPSVYFSLSCISLSKVC